MCVYLRRCDSKQQEVSPQTAWQTAANRWRITQKYNALTIELKANCVCFQMATPFGLSEFFRSKLRGMKTYSKDPAGPSIRRMHFRGHRKVERQMMAIIEDELAKMAAYWLPSSQR